MNTSQEWWFIIVLIGRISSASPAMRMSIRNVESPSLRLAV